MGEDRLDSWKEIAAYLKRDVTTVQRWEKREGMPVHRHLHDKLGSVYASRSELDAWTRSRTLAQTPTRDEKETAKSAPARLSWALAVGAAVVVLAAIGAYAWLRAHTELFWRSPVGDVQLKRVTDFGGIEQAAAISR